MGAYGSPSRQSNRRDFGLQRGPVLQRVRSTLGTRHILASLLVTSALVPLPVFAGDALPTGGQFTAGSGTISQSGSTLTVNQSSTAGIINWTGFSIGQGNSAHFDNGSGATLNRVTGNIQSRIDGALSATGSLFLINPAGVVVGTGGMVATGGSFVASTHDVTDGDFLDGGSVTFKGTSQAGVLNAGTITSAQGDVALIARSVANTGTLEAPNGTVGLAAGYEILMKDATDADGLLSVKIGGSDTEAVNTGTIEAANAELRAQGGNVYALAGNTDSVVKASGVSHTGGRIFLTAGDAGSVKVTGRLQARRNAASAPPPVPNAKPALDGGAISIAAGNVDISGSIDASAEGAGTQGGTVMAIAGQSMTFSGWIEAKGGEGGEGGFVETSGKTISIADTARVSTLADGGKAGTWLIDPADLTIAASGGDMTGATVSANLALGNVVLDSDTGATGTNGDIFINDAITWSADTTLTLDAVRNIEINADIAASGTNADLVLTYGGNYAFGGGTVTLSGASAGLTLNGTAYTLIHDVNELQAITGAGNYALAETIDATGTVSWNAGAGWAPINGFSGVLAGLGNTIDGLTVNRPGDASVGMFASTTGDFRDFTLSNVSIVSGGNAGALAYRVETGALVKNVHVTGSVTAVGGGGQVGGLIGWLDQSIVANSSSTATVTGFGEVGGLIGRLRAGTIIDSYATGAVTGTTDYVGGLVGDVTQGATLTNVYASGNVTGTTNVGGLVGGELLSGTVTATNAYWDVDSTGQSTSFAGTGIANANAYTQSTYSGFDFANTWVIIPGRSRPMLQSEYSTSIATAHQLQLVSLDVGADYTLVGDIDMTSAFVANGGGYYGDVWGSGGFVTIGTGVDPFTGSLDGLDHEIIGLTVNGGGGTYKGLFGSVSGAAFSNLSLVDATVTGGGYVGALAGYAWGGSTFTNVHAGGSVTASSGYTGMLVGSLAGSSITNSSSSGSVTALDTAGNAGGLVGQINSTAVLDQVFSTANVRGNRNLGGLVGTSQGAISNAYAMGSVTGVASGGSLVQAIGALVGGQGGGSITSSFATGYVSGASDRGGLVGANPSNVTNSYWDKETTGTPTDAGGTAATTAELQGALPTGFDSAIWGIGANLYPYLKWQFSSTPVAVSGKAYSDAGTTALAGADVSAISGGSLLGGATTGANGYYYILAAPGSIDAAGALAYLDGEASVGAGFADTVTATGVSGLDIHADALNVITSASALSDTKDDYLTTTGGSYADTDLDFIWGGSVFGTQTGYELSVHALSDVMIDRDLQTSGTLTLSTDGTFSVVDAGGGIGQIYGAEGTRIDGDFDWTNTSGILVGGPTLVLNGSVTAPNGSFGIVTDGSTPFVMTGAVNVDSFSLRGVWQQIGASLPDFSANTIQFDAGSSFIRALGGDGSSADPYQIADVYGLQGMASEGLLADHFVLANDIDASATAGWNGGLGFDPIGDEEDPADIAFSGSLDGQGHTINGLTINRSGENYVGLIGSASGATVANLALSGGSIVGDQVVGALAGTFNGGSITSVTSSLSVEGSNFVGGLVAASQQNTAFSLSSASGDVTGSGYAVGGLIGALFEGTITQSYATGTVSGSVGVGGLVGANGYASPGGVIDQSFATGNVTASVGTAGGFVGINQGTITNSYATGNVTGTGTASKMGGFIGEIISGSIDSAYSTGQVFGSSEVGGFAGSSTVDASAITSAYWDTETSGTANGIGSGDGGITARTTAQLQGTLPAGFSSAIWATGEGLYPYFDWFLPGGATAVSGYVYSDAGTTAFANANVSAISGGSLVGSAGAGANGYYYILAAPGSLDASGVIAYLDGEATQGAAFSDDVATSGVTSLDILGSSLNVMTAQGALSDTLANLTTTLGAYADTDLDFIDTSATQLTTSGQGLYLDAASAYTLDQDLTSGGLLSLTSGGTFTIDADRTLKSTNAGSILLNSGVTWNGTGTLTLTSDDDIALNGAIDGQSGGLTLSASGNGGSDYTGTIAPGAGGSVDVGTFTLSRGVWDQVGGSLPSFSAGSITVSGLSTFIRAQGGDGTYLNPYQLFDVYGLQGIADRDQRVGAGSFDYSLYYELANDIDASATSSWNSGAGFDPVNFSGSLDGAGHTIDGLYINRPSESNVALIGYWQDNYFTSGRDLEIKDLTLTNASVTGDSQTAILVGDTGGGNYHGHNMSNVTVSGTVEANSWGAGVVARYYGNINQSTMTNVHADVSVRVTSGGSSAGGLVSIMGEGLTISNSSSTGTINGGWAGGLVGTVDDENNRIETSYSTATVIASGSFRVGGGLVGETEDLTIANSYFAGQVLGTNGASAGGLVGAADRNTVIENSFVTGRVEAEGDAGALVAEVGDSSVSITNAAWDIGTTGQSDWLGRVTAYTPTTTNIGSRTTAQMQGTLDFGLGFSLDNSIWATGDGLYPYFGWQFATTPVAVTGTAYSDGGTTALVGADVSAISGGSLLGSASTGANGYYYILTAAGSLDASGTLAYLDGEATRAGAFSDAVTATGVSGLDIYGSSLNLIAGGSSLGGTLTNLNATLGAYSDTDLNFFNPVSTKVTYDGYGLYLQADQAYTIDGNLTSGSFLSVSGSGTYSVSGDRTLKSTNGGSIALDSGFTWSGSGALALEADDNITLNGAIDGQNGRLALSASGNGSSDDVGTITTGAGGTVDVGRFDLIRGTWEQTGATLPSFSADDFRLASVTDATFIRARGGDGTIANPYQLFDLYGLQGITVRDARSTDSADYGVNYRLAGDIDASATRNWNGGAGFAPVLLGGNLDGDGHTIDGLFINRPGEWAGLVYYWSDRATGDAPDVEIRDLSITNADVTGSSAGILFAQQSAGAVAHDLTNIFVSGTVTGTSGVGGVAGSAWGNLDGTGGQSTVSNVHADVTVTATGTAGGLFGNANEEVTILNSSSTGTVNGAFNAGGLVGSNTDGSTIRNSYSTATVNGANAGGLVGNAEQTTISNSFHIGNVSGTNSVGGLVGAADRVEIFDAYSSGTVTATGGSGNAGGIVGYAGRNVAIRTSYATGAVSGATAGGLVGAMSSTGNSITDSVWDVETTGQSAAAGVPGSAAITNVDGVTTAELMQLSTFLAHGFDIDDEGSTGTVWRIYEGYTAPLLRSFMTGVTVTADNQSKTYDGMAFSPFTYTSSIPGAVLEGTLGSDLTSADAGTYVIRNGLYSGQLGYDITMVAGALTIDPKALTVTADAISKSYGDANPTLTFGYSGLVASDDASVFTGVLTTSVDGTTGVGSYTIGQGTLAAGGNYTIDFTGANLTVNARAITVTADSYARDEGTPNPALTWQITTGNLVNGDALSGMLDTDADINSPAGIYAITQGSLEATPNYAVTFVPGQLTVNGEPVPPTEPGYPTPPQTFEGDAPLAVSPDGLGDPQLRFCEIGIVGSDAVNVVYPCNQNFGSWLSAAAQ